MKKSHKILTELMNELDIPKETLASKMGVSVITIVRWQRKLTKPTYAELKLLKTESVIRRSGSTYRLPEPPERGSL